MSDRTWKPLGGVDPTIFVDTRLQLHYAAQVVAGAARALLPPNADHSHTALHWSESGGGLYTDTLPGDLRVGLVFTDRRLVISGPKGDEDYHLQDHTLADAYLWLTNALTARLGRPVSVTATDDYTMPEHPIGSGASFSASPDAARILGDGFANADLVLQPYAARDGGSPVRCWPHHFDLAVLVTLEAGADAEASRSVGLGLTPGDAGIAFPYFYVTPWPYPPESPTTELPEGGHWNTEGWIGAVLPASKFVVGEPGEQRGRVERFLGVAFGILGFGGGSA